jgi:hypothetical protein
VIPTDPHLGPSGKARTRSREVLGALTAAAVLVLIAVIVAAIAGGSGAGTSPRPARAANPVETFRPSAALPVVYSQVEGWHGGQVRPAVIYVGQGGAPYVNALKWTGWTTAGAQANGYLHVQKPGCTLPTYQCPYQSFRAQVRLSQVETHNGVRYYSRMRWTYVKNHVPRVIRWKTSKGYWRN